MARTPAKRAVDWLSDRLWRGLLAVLRRLPYARRVRAGGWLWARVLGPIAGYTARADANLARIWPGMEPARRRRLARGALDNAGRTLLELYSGDELKARLAGTEPRGPGLAALRDAQARRRPVILVTGHFGNYAAAWTVLRQAGFEIGGFYRPMANPWFDSHYAREMERHGGPIFRQDKRGTAGLMRHLRGGGMAVILLDQHRGRGAMLDFLGVPAATTTEPAAIARRLGALIVPFYGIRGETGVDFDVIVEAPLPDGPPTEVMAAFNRSLGDRVRAHPAQWFWPHRRWKSTERRLSADAPRPEPRPAPPPG